MFPRISHWQLDFLLCVESRNFFFYTHDIVLSDVYLVWPSNKTTPDFEIMFKALTDDGKTFEPKINPSNSTGIDSERPEIAAFGNNVYVTWWERNQTSNEPVLGVSNDSGKTFGEKIMLSAK
jgi:hypothetical protein